MSIHQYVLSCIDVVLEIITLHLLLSLHPILFIKSPILSHKTMFRRPILLNHMGVDPRSADAVARSCGYPFSLVKFPLILTDHFH